MKHKYRIKEDDKSGIQEYVCDDIWYKLSKEQIIERLMYYEDYIEWTKTYGIYPSDMQREQRLKEKIKEMKEKR